MRRSVGSETIDVLTHKCRMLTAGQVARLSFGHTKEPRVIARQWLRRQEKQGLIRLHHLLTHPEIDICEPLLDYHPGDPTPDFSALAWQARSRWTDPPELTLVASATKKARQLTGGVIGGRPVRSREVTHDIHCASVYLHFLKFEPELAACWVAEDALSHLDGCKVPDAIIEAKSPIYIEFAGQYSAAKLRECHAHFSKKGFRYQLW